MKLDEGLIWQNYLKKLSNIGFVTLSASRLENSDEENAKLTKELKQFLVDSKFAFKPVGGEYSELGEKDSIIRYPSEKSFLVAAFDKRAKKVADFQELLDMAKERGEHYHQQTIMICEPKKDPYYFHLKSESNPEEFADKAFNKITFDEFDVKFGTSNDKGEVLNPKSRKTSPFYNDKGKTNAVKHSFTFYRGKRAPTINDKEDVIEYTDEELKDAKEKGIDLDKKDKWLDESKKAEKNEKQRLFEAIFVANCGDFNGGSEFKPVEEKKPGDDYNLINEWVAQKMGIIRESKKADKLQEMNVGWAIEVKLSNGKWTRPSNLTKTFSTKAEAEEYAKDNPKLKDREYRAVNLSDKKGE